MQKRLTLAALALGLVLALPSLAWAKDEASGKRMKLKNAKVVQVLPQKGTVVVKKDGAVYNIVLALANPDKLLVLSKYGVNVDPWELKPGDHITCRGRRFPAHFVPSKCRIEKDSQKDLYKEKKGKMVADVYAVDADNGLIYAANALNKTDLTTIKKGSAKITYKGEKRSLSKLKPYWRLLIKGKWDSSKKMFKDVKYIKILDKLKNVPVYGF